MKCIKVFYSQKEECIKMYQKLQTWSCNRIFKNKNMNKERTERFKTL